MAKQVDFIRGNENLKKANTVEYVSQDVQQEYIRELIRCREDILYFAEKYFTIISPAKGKHLIKMYPKQKDLLNAMVDNNRVISCASRQVGKCLFRDTKIKIRNKQTLEIEELTIEEFHKRFQPEK